MSPGANDGRGRAPGALALALCLALAVGAWGCAKGGGSTPASQLWETFSQRRAGAGGARGILATASLHYAEDGQSHRVTLKLWGAPGLPLRLDMAAGIGTAVAMLREGPEGWAGYFPSEGAAYESRSAIRGQRALGMDLPFTLRELAGLATGTYAGFAPDGYVAGTPLPGGGARFDFARGGSVTAMTLDAQGRPVVFAGRLNGKPWTMTLSRHDEGPSARASRLDISMEPDTRATLRVKRLERRDEAWADEALALPLPPGTTVTPLDATTGNTGG